MRSARCWTCCMASPPPATQVLHNNNSKTISLCPHFTSSHHIMTFLFHQLRISLANHSPSLFLYFSRFAPLFPTLYPFLSSTLSLSFSARVSFLSHTHSTSTVICLDCSHALSG